MTNAVFMALRPFFCPFQFCCMNYILLYFVLFAYSRRFDEYGEACALEENKDKLWYSVDNNLYDDKLLYT